MPRSPAWTVISSPRSKRTSDRLPVRLADDRVTGVGRLGEHAARRRRVPEVAVSLEHIGEGVARGLHRQALPLARRHPDVEVARVGRHAVHRAGLAPEAPADDPHRGAVVIGHLGDVLGHDVLVARRRHLQLRGQVGPELEAVHPPLRIALRHFLVHDAPPRRHPLHVPGPQGAGVAQAVAVAHGAGQHVGDGFDPPVRVPREPREVVGGALIAEVVEEQEGVEFGGLSEAEGAMELDPGALHGGLGFDDFLDGPDGHGLPS